VDKTIKGTNKIFIEMPSIVTQYLLKGYLWKMIKYDTIAARIPPGGNTGTKKEYYTESPIENWASLVGKEFRFHAGFVQLKARASLSMVIKEIKNQVRIDKMVLIEPLFWFFSISAIILPGFIIKPLYNFYRHRISRHFYKIIGRNYGVQI
jgi:hypothetical protein